MRNVTALVLALTMLAFLFGCLAQEPQQGVAPATPAQLGPSQPNASGNATPAQPPVQPTVPATLPNTTTLPPTQNATVPTVSTAVNTVFPTMTASTPPPSETTIIVQSQPVPQMSVSSGNVSIIIKNAKFLPGKITILAGTNVTWVNQDSLTHRIAGSGFDSGNLTSGQNFSYVFSSLGVFSYNTAYLPQVPSGIVQVVSE